MSYPYGFIAVSSIFKAELFPQALALNSLLDDSGLIPPSLAPSDYVMPLINITYTDVFYAFSGFDSRKSYGLGGVPPIVLINCASVLHPCVVKRFHPCLSTATFPSSWKFAHIQPVPKKGDRSNTSNYRPIALIS